MEIHELNTKALTDPAYVAFDDGTDTYKTEFNDVVADAAAAAVAEADLTDNTVAFTSGDSASPTEWTAVDVLTSGLSLKTLFNRISTMIKNVRYIWSKIGTASMGTTATTITGAIAEHETDISGLNSNKNKHFKYYSSTGTNRNAVLYSLMTSIINNYDSGECDLCTIQFDGSTYCGFIWKGSTKAMFGRMYKPNAGTGFYFRVSTDDTTATSTDF